MNDLNLNRRNAKNPNLANGAAAAAEAKDDRIPVDGFAQVIQLLQVADASFRESLLRRLTAKDPALARQLREYLARNG